jgi:hypothetical protein
LAGANSEIAMVVRQPWSALALIELIQARRARQDHGRLQRQRDAIQPPRRSRASAALPTRTASSLPAVNRDSWRCWRAGKIEYRYRTLSPRALNRRAAPLSAAGLERGEVMLTGLGQPAFDDEQARRCRAGGRGCGRRRALCVILAAGTGGMGAETALAGPSGCRAWPTLNP